MAWNEWGSEPHWCIAESRRNKKCKGPGCDHVFFVQCGKRRINLWLEIIGYVRRVAGPRSCSVLQTTVRLCALDCEWDESHWKILSSHHADYIKIHEIIWTTWKYEYSKEEVWGLPTFKSVSEGISKGD